MAVRPPPGLRTRPSPGVTPDRISLMPLAIVVDDIPVALATAAKPPRQRFRACPMPDDELVQLARRRRKAMRARRPGPDGASSPTTSTPSPSQPPENIRHALARAPHEHRRPRSHQTRPSPFPRSSPYPREVELRTRILRPRPRDSARYARADAKRAGSRPRSGRGSFPGIGAGPGPCHRRRHDVCTSQAHPCAARSGGGCGTAAAMKRLPAPGPGLAARVAKAGVRVERCRSPANSTNPTPWGCRPYRSVREPSRTHR